MYKQALHKLKARNLNFDEFWSAAHLSRRSAVMLLLYPSEDAAGATTNALLTVRASTVSYGGDVALPGGKADNLEESYKDVVLRESKEEIGLNSADLQFVSPLPPYASSRLHLVQPVLYYTEKRPQIQSVDAREVADVFGLDIMRFISYTSPNTAIDELFFPKVPSFLTKNDSNTYRVWGLTANILIDCARLLSGECVHYNYLRGSQVFVKANEIGDLNTIGNIRTLKYALNKGILGRPLPSKTK